MQTLMKSRSVTWLLDLNYFHISLRALKQPSNKLTRLLRRLRKTINSFLLHLTALYNILFFRPFRFPVRSLYKALSIFRSACLSVRELRLPASLHVCINIETQPSNLSLHSFLFQFLLLLSLTRFWETFSLVQQPLASRTTQPLSPPQQTVRVV